MDLEGYPRGHGSRARIDNGKEMHARLDPSFKRAGLGMKVTIVLSFIGVIALIAVVVGFL